MPIGPGDDIHYQLLRQGSSICVSSMTKDQMAISCSNEHTLGTTKTTLQVPFHEILQGRSIGLQNMTLSRNPRYNHKVRLESFGDESIQSELSFERHISVWHLT